MRLAESYRAEMLAAVALLVEAHRDLLREKTTSSHLREELRRYTANAVRPDARGRAA